MDDNVVIKASCVSKKFTRNLKSLMKYGFYDIGRSTLGMSIDSSKLRKDEFWAVDDVSFELRRGETLGIIGPNGSGKSTMLKMLNGIYMPDKGSIEIKGKVGALIEVGAGFSPMLTGRENIYVNGAILGMSKKEIDKKFDDIVAFADIGDFLDSPVKTYSSGMYVRLGFAVAIHCEPDILLVDEILAVGDSNFQRKSFEKMSSFIKGGASIIFISHNMTTVSKFCNSALLLDHGKIITGGTSEDVIKFYQKRVIESYSNPSLIKELVPKKEICSEQIAITKVVFSDKNNKLSNEFEINETLKIKIYYKANQNTESPQILINLWNIDGVRICSWATHFENIKNFVVEKGEGLFECIVQDIPLQPNKFYINIGIYDSSRMLNFDWWDGLTRSDLCFIIKPNNMSISLFEYPSICYLKPIWKINDMVLHVSK